MKVYVDTSAVLRRVFHQPGRIENWGSWDLAVTSELTWVEAQRSIDRLRVQREMAGADVANLLAFLRSSTARFREVRISRAILESAAAPLPTVVGTLDAIHLATARAWMRESGDRLAFVTHDRELAIAATASGLEVLPRPSFLSG